MHIHVALPSYNNFQRITTTQLITSIRYIKKIQQNYQIGMQHISISHECSSHYANTYIHDHLNIIKKIDLIFTWLTN